MNSANACARGESVRKGRVLARDLRPDRARQEQSSVHAVDKISKIDAPERNAIDAYGAILASVVEPFAVALNVRRIDFPQ